MMNLFRPLLVLTGCIVLASCVSQKQFKGLKTDYTKLQTEYQESQLQLRENQARSTSLEERLADSLNLVMVNKLTRSLTREEMRDLDIKVLKGVVYISLADNMLYKSGSYEISNKAEAVLSKIAKIIQDYKDYDVLVEGNTDTDPISRTNIRNNWDLSALRASSVVQALQNIYGINPKRLTAAGRGEFNPVAGNDTAEGKARNRRTEIIITPKLDQFMDLIDQAPDNSSSGIMGDENTKE